MCNIKQKTANELTNKLIDADNSMVVTRGGREKGADERGLKSGKYMMKEGY